MADVNELADILVSQVVECTPQELLRRVRIVARKHAKHSKHLYAYQIGTVYRRTVFTD